MSWINNNNNSDEILMTPTLLTPPIPPTRSSIRLNPPKKATGKHLGTAPHPWSLQITPIGQPDQARTTIRLSPAFFKKKEKKGKKKKKA